jgi:hypothetical protein
MMKKGGYFTICFVLASSLRVQVGMQTKNPGGSKAVEKHFYQANWSHISCNIAANIHKSSSQKLTAHFLQDQPWWELPASFSALQQQG